MSYSTAIHASSTRSDSAWLGDLPTHDHRPLYAQFAQLLRKAITDGRLEAGAALPPERDLAAEYGVSRITIRRAIAELAEDGLLTRKQGAGTTVTRRIEQNFSRISSFSEEMAARGQVASSSWILRAQGIVTPAEAMQLNLSPGAPVMRFHRVRIADDAPMRSNSRPSPAIAWAASTTSRNRCTPPSPIPIIARPARCSGCARYRSPAPRRGCCRSMPEPPDC